RLGSGVLPRRFPVALKALPEPWRLDRSGDRGAKTRKGF
ncbi:rep protein, partial [Escherichia coli]